MLVYLAGAIDFADERKFEWREKAKKALNQLGVHCFDPAGAFSWSNKAWESRAEELKKVNYFAINECDVVLAEYHFDCQHTGTLMEIMFALRNGIPVVLWKEGQLPLYLVNSRVVHEQSLDNALERIIEWHSVVDKDECKCEQLELKVKKLHPFAQLPTKAYPSEDAGWDITVLDGRVVEPMESEDIPTGIAIEMSPGMYGRLIGRSSGLRKHGFVVNEGTIDNGYRGELFVNILNVTDKNIEVRPGDRIAQLIIHRIEPVRVVVVDELSPSERGSKGFGSSGR